MKMMSSWQQERLCKDPLLNYEAYVQGGLTYEHVKIAVTRAVMNLKEQNLI